MTVRLLEGFTRDLRFFDFWSLGSMEAAFAVGKPIVPRGLWRFSGESARRWRTVRSWRVG
jgi:hypothetical protein